MHQVAHTSFALQIKGNLDTAVDELAHLDEVLLGEAARGQRRGS